MHPSPGPPEGPSSPRVAWVGRTAKGGMRCVDVQRSWKWTPEFYLLSLQLCLAVWASGDRLWVSAFPAVKWAGRSPTELMREEDCPVLVKSGDFGNWFPGFKSLFSLLLALWPQFSHLRRWEANTDLRRLLCGSRVSTRKTHNQDGHSNPLGNICNYHHHLVVLRITFFSIRNKRVKALSQATKSHC